MTHDPHLTEGLRSHAVAWWHTTLRAIAVLNRALWSLAAAAVTREAAADTASRLQLLLSAIYVGGCAYRCFLPVIDIPRLVLIDSRLSSVLVGRSIATAAELAFAAQWALLLHGIAASGGSPLGQAASLALLPLIVLAEGFSWYAVLTTQQRPHAVENSLWGVSAALVVAGVWAIGPARLGALYVPAIAGGLAYVAFIFVYDVPMYWSRWRIDQASRRQYLSIAAGLIDARRWAVSNRWDDWRNEVPWMSLYFSFGVWSSVWLVYQSLASLHGN